MITYQDYKDNGGALSEAEFNSTLPCVRNLFDLFIQEKLPSWRILPLEEYGFNLTVAFVEQIDFIHLNGGLNVMKGRSDYNIKSVTTSGINLSLSSRNIEMFNGIPIAPLATSNINRELRKKGLLSSFL